MEILSVLAPSATPVPTKAVVATGEDFTAFLESAEGMLVTDGSPPVEGVLSVGEVAETDSIAPPQSLDLVPNAALAIVTNPFVASIPTSLPAPSSAPIVVPPASSTAAKPGAWPTTETLTEARLPEAPVPTDIFVEVFQVNSDQDPMLTASTPTSTGATEARGTGVPPGPSHPNEAASSSPSPTSAVPIAAKPPQDLPIDAADETAEGLTVDRGASDLTASLVEKGSVDTSPSDGEDAPEPESSEPTVEMPRAEGKAEARAEGSVRADAPAKMETVRGPTRLDTHNVVRELANRIELMAAAKNPEGVVIHLQPADLGSITLIVKPDSGEGVSAKVGASNDQVRQALEASQGTLTRQLELRGHVVASVSVSAETAQRDPQRQSQGQQSGFQPRQFHSQASSRSPQYGSSDPIARPSRLKATGVDLWI
ncbi:MAG: flagellar hook-length control protein FliK [Fimbriimonas sp.]